MAAWRAGQRSTVDTEMLILSIGVRPESQLAADAGLTLGMRGTVATNEHMQTSDPDIYSVGDVCEVRLTASRPNRPIWPWQVPPAGQRDPQGPARAVQLPDGAAFLLCYPCSQPVGLRFL